MTDLKMTDFLRFQDFNKKACLDIAELYKNPKFNREYVRRRDDLKREKQAEVTDKRLEVSNSKKALSRSIRDQKRVSEFFKDIEGGEQTIFGVRQLVFDGGPMLRYHLPACWKGSKHFKRNQNYIYLSTANLSNPVKLWQEEIRLFGKEISFDTREEVSFCFSCFLHI